MRSGAAFIYFFLLLIGFTQAQDSVNADMFVKKDFLILLSTKSYNAALAAAKNVASSLKMKLDLRGLAENKEAGLTWPKEVCEKEDEDFPAYYARGRYDDGVYVSIEYSNAYSEFAKGYYIVMAASGKKEDPQAQAAYKKIKASFKDVYFKSSKVYMGCMH